MSTETRVAPKLARGHFRCNACSTTMHARFGDWFISNGADKYQQIFLCKKCEVTMKDCYKRAIPLRS
jgi:hypothetical protein